jgi:hypothetical protein
MALLELASEGTIVVDHLQHVLDSFIQEIVVIDQYLRITYANPAWLRRVDLVAAPVVGRPCHQVLLKADAPCTLEECAVQQVFRSHQPIRLSHWSCGRGMSLQETPISASPVFDCEGLVVEVVEILYPSEPPPDRPPLAAAEAARLPEAEHRQNAHLVRELTSLMRVSQAVNEAHDLDTILNIALDQALSLVGSEKGSIILIDPPNGDRLSIVAERGLGPEAVEAFNNRPVHTDEGSFNRALSSGVIVEVADTAADPDLLRRVGSRATRVTNIPLMTPRGPIGLITVDGLPRDETVRHAQAVRQ